MAGRRAPAALPGTQQTYEDADDEAMLMLGPACAAEKGTAAETALWFSSIKAAKGKGACPPDPVAAMFTAGYSQVGLYAELSVWAVLGLLTRQGIGAYAAVAYPSTLYDPVVRYT